MKVTGSVGLTAANPAEAIADPDFKLMVQHGIAELAGVQPDDVKVVLSMMGNAGRRLNGDGNIKVDYEVTVDATTSVSVHTVHDNLAQQTPATITTAINNHIPANSDIAPITVNVASTPEVATRAPCITLPVESLELVLSMSQDVVYCDPENMRRRRLLGLSVKDCKDKQTPGLARKLLDRSKAQKKRATKNKKEATKPKTPEKFLPQKAAKKKSRTVYL